MRRFVLVVLLACAPCFGAQAQDQDLSEALKKPAYKAAWNAMLKGQKVPGWLSKFTKTGEDWFCFAGLWHPMPDGGEAFTLLTTEPGPDVAPIHDRQVVVLERSNWSAWLEETGNEPELLRALAAGSLNVEQVR